MSQPIPQPPIMGSWNVTIVAARPFTIHSDAYFEISVQQQNAPGVVTLRVPEHACALEPRPGQHAQIAFLMGQVTKVIIHADPDQPSAAISDS